MAYLRVSKAPPQLFPARLRRRPTFSPPHRSHPTASQPATSIWPILPQRQSSRTRMGRRRTRNARSMRVRRPRREQSARSERRRRKRKRKSERVKGRMKATATDLLILFADQTIINALGLVFSPYLGAMHILQSAKVPLLRLRVDLLSRDPRLPRHRRPATAYLQASDAVTEEKSLGQANRMRCKSSAGAASELLLKSLYSRYALGGNGQLHRGNRRSGSLTGWIRND